MPIRIKTAGAWSAARPVGNVHILTGSGPAIFNQVMADGPQNFWPIQDSQSAMVCADIVGTKSTTYDVPSGDTTHPNPWDANKRHRAKIPGGNPFRTFSAVGVTIECVFKTTWVGALFGYQDVALTSS